MDQVPTVHERQQIVVGEPYERIETGNLVTGGQEFYRVWTPTKELGTRVQVGTFIASMFNSEKDMKYQTRNEFDPEWLQTKFLVVSFIFGALRNQNYTGSSNGRQKPGPKGPAGRFEVW